MQLMKACIYILNGNSFKEKVSGVLLTFIHQESDIRKPLPEVQEDRIFFGE
jgi:hypothetical protein